MKNNYKAVSNNCDLFTWKQYREIKKNKTGKDRDLTYSEKIKRKRKPFVKTVVLRKSVKGGSSEALPL